MKSVTYKPVCIRLLISCFKNHTPACCNIWSWALHKLRVYCWRRLEGRYMELIPSEVKRLRHISCRLDELLFHHKQRWSDKITAVETPMLEMI